MSARTAMPLAPGLWPGLSSLKPMMSAGIWDGSPQPSAPAGGVWWGLRATARVASYPKPFLGLRLGLAPLLLLPRWLWSAGRSAGLGWLGSAWSPSRMYQPASGSVEVYGASA